MNCTSLQALVEASSLGKCLDTELSVQSSGTPTLNLSLWHDKTMDVSRHSRYGMTCKPLTGDRGAELLTSWLAGFPVKTYPQPEKAQELTESAAECGRTWRGWLAKYDPSSSLWKTAQCSFIEDLGESLATFPRSGMTRDGLLWELPMLERRTSVTGSGFWPTPVASDTSSRKKPYAQGGTPLSLAVKMWPTPTGGGKSKTTCLGDWGGSGARKKLRQLVTDAELFGPLNPSWVEWLMGWPIGHTALKPSETARCHSALPKPSEFCMEACE